MAFPYLQDDENPAFGFRGAAAIVQMVTENLTSTRDHFAPKRAEWSNRCPASLGNPRDNNRGPTLPWIHAPQRCRYLPGGIRDSRFNRAGPDYSSRSCFAVEHCQLDPSIFSVPGLRGYVKLKDSILCNEQLKTAFLTDRTCSDPRLEKPDPIG